MRAKISASDGIGFFSGSYVATVLKSTNGLSTETFTGSDSLTGTGSGSATGSEATTATGSGSTTGSVASTTGSGSLTVSATLAVSTFSSSAFTKGLGMFVSVVSDLTVSLVSDVAVVTAKSGITVPFFF